MAVAIGTSSGFVSSAPVDDPAGTNAPMDTHAIVTKDTSPATATKITEVGWYCDNATEESNFEVGLYAADGAVVPGEAGTRLYISATNAKGTTSGWKRVTVDWAINPSTIYWIALQLDDTATLTNANYTSPGGSGMDDRTGQTTLSDPFGGGVIVLGSGMAAIYVLWQAASGESTASRIYYRNMMRRQ